MKKWQAVAGADPPLCRMGCGHYGMRSELFMCSVCSRLVVGKRGRVQPVPITLPQMYEAALRSAGVGMATGAEAAVLKAACRSTVHCASIKEAHVLLTGMYQELVDARGALFLVLEHDGVEMMHLLAHGRDEFYWFTLSHLVGRLVYIPWMALRNTAFHSSTLCYHGNMGDLFSDQSGAQRMAVNNPSSVYRGTRGFDDEAAV